MINKLNYLLLILLGTFKEYTQIFFIHINSKDEEKIQFSFLRSFEQKQTNKRQCKDIKKVLLPIASSGS